MKNKLQFLSRCRLAALGWLAGLALLCGTASAQNFVKNPSFEDPLGPDNWTVEYTGVTVGPAAAANRPTNSCANDFLIHGRTCHAHKDLGKPSSGVWDGDPTYWNKFGAHLKPNHNWLCHAYFKQVVTNLTPNASYSISAWITQWGRTDVSLVYLEALGGLGSKKTPYVTADARNNPAGWQRYAVTNTADANGQIEVQLHLCKNTSTANWVYLESNAFFDDVAVVPAGQTEYMPPYKIVAFARTNQDITLTWETVMNNQYRLQCSTNVSDPSSWVFVQRSPYLDTNWAATATSFTFKTNLLSLFSYDPGFDPSAPLFFRIHSTSYKH